MPIAKNLICVAGVLNQMRQAGLQWAWAHLVWNSNRRSVRTCAVPRPTITAEQCHNKCGIGYLGVRRCSALSIAVLSPFLLSIEPIDHGKHLTKSESALWPFFKAYLKSKMFQSCPRLTRGLRGAIVEDGGAYGYARNRSYEEFPWIQGDDAPEAACRGPAESVDDEPAPLPAE